jgi:CTD kinase subunit beta
LLDLLELYTHYRNNTTIGPEFPVDVFLEVRIPLNQEMDAKHLPRFTEWKDHKSITNGATKTSNGTKTSPKESSNIASPSTPALANGTRGRIGERGRDGTVRFMLNPEREQEEKAIVAEYFKPIEEEEIEVEEPRRR